MFFIISLVGISLAIALVPHLIYIIVKILSRIFCFGCSYRPYGYVALAMVAVWIVLALYGNIWGRFRHETKTIDLTFNKLPKGFDGYRIVQISDFHLDGWEGHKDKLQTIVDEVNSYNPDMIVFTGDIVSIKDEELRPFVSILKSLKAKDGVYSILGNHDYMTYAHGWSDEERASHLQNLKDMECKDLGWNLLLNENRTIHHNGDSIALLGSENQSMGIHHIIQRGDLKKTMDGTDGMFRILLTHDPSDWRAEVLRKTDIPLTLSGHTHGGQMSIGDFYVSAFIYKEHAGLYTENNQNLYVNIGLGGTMPTRIGATPEITVINLRK